MWVVKGKRSTTGWAKERGKVEVATQQGRWVVVEYDKERDRFQVYTK